MKAQKGMQEKVLASKADFILIGHRGGAGVTTAMLMHAAAHNLNASFVDGSKYLKDKAIEVFDVPIDDWGVSIVYGEGRAIVVRDDTWITGEGWVYVECKYSDNQSKIVEILKDHERKLMLSEIPSPESWTAKWYDKSGFFYIYGSSMDDVVFGDTRVEVYNKVKDIMHEKGDGFWNIKSFEYIDSDSEQMHIY